MSQFELAQPGIERKAQDSADKFRVKIIALLPRLSVFAHCLTGNTEQTDNLVQETCVRALADKHQRQSGTNLTYWVFRIAHNVWFDRQRAKMFRSESVDIEVADHLAGSDVRPVTQSKIVLADLLRALNQLSPEHRVLIALVSVCGFNYTEAAKILSLPVRKVMSRLARGRLVLHDAINATIASKATQH